jgi:small nuclear ribonucleoprotein G
MCVHNSSHAMSAKGPNLKSELHSDRIHISYLFRSYLDKEISLHLNKGRKVSGTLRGYDQFMNIVLGDALEEVSTNETKPIGMVVCKSKNFCPFISSSYFYFFCLR